ncbi:MAG: hypothetical protein ABSH36_12690 [Solirubrobacteraceae bacterium]
MIKTPAHFTVRALLAALIFTGVAGVFGVVLPATAGAYATPAPENIYSSAPGLPDGRVYEQVSPANKNSNEAGAEDKREEVAPFIDRGAVPSVLEEEICV